jgi:outer membrane protein assembly factor BamA
MPKLAGGRAFVDTQARARRSPQIDYYGPGSGSEVTGRTVYAMEESSLEARAGVNLVDRFRAGVAARYLAVNVGPARRPEFAPAEAVYSEAVTPGLDRQTSFLAGGPYIEYDSRDLPGGPRNGGLYRASYNRFSDSTLDRYSFHRIDAEAQRYFSFFNGRKVIALRGRVNLTDADEDDAVPFYLQPQLGGANDLRGFRARRFYGGNAAVMNAEYRWEVFSGLDAALFVDAGKVFDRWDELNFRNLETSRGFGLRFNIGNAVFLRGDVAFGREGPQAWIVLENVF